MTAQIRYIKYAILIRSLLSCSRVVVRRRQVDDFSRSGRTTAVHDLPGTLARPAQTATGIPQATAEAITAI